MTTIVFIFPVIIMVFIATLVHMGSVSYWSGCKRSAIMCTVLISLTVSIVTQSLSIRLIAVSLWVFAFSFAIAMMVGIPFRSDYRKFPNVTEPSEHTWTLLPNSIAELLTIVFVFSFVLAVSMLSNTPAFITVPAFVLLIGFLRFAANV